MPVAASIFIHFFCISFLGIGGFFVTLPDIYRWIVAADGLMTPEAFQAAVAIGQASPGPNMIICWAIGWFAMGPAGAAAALAGTVIPFSTLALIVGRFFSHHASSLAVRAYRVGMAPVSIALLYAAGYTLLAPNLSLPMLALAALTMALICWTKVPAIVLIAIGGVVGALGFV